MSTHRHAVLSLALASTCLSQSPLTTTFSGTAYGNVGNAVYFDLACTRPTGVTIDRIDLNFTAPAGTAGSVDVFVAPFGSAITAAQWLLVATAPVITAGQGQPTIAALSAPIEMSNGCALRLGIRANGLAHCYSGTGASLVYANPDLTLTAGLASNIPFASPVFSPRVANATIHYQSAGSSCPPLSMVVARGHGCTRQFASFYEQFTTAAQFDLAGTAITMVSTGGGYIITNGGTLNPLGSLAPPSVVPLTDDSQAAVGTLGLYVGSNGWVALGAGNSNAYSPNVVTLLGNPSTAFYSWKDLNPSIPGSGQVHYEESGTQAQVTYAGVWDFGGTSATHANYFQIQIDTATGNAVMAWGTMSGLGGSSLVGYSPGGPNGDPGNSDLSALGVVQVYLPEQLPLTLDPSSGPASQGVTPHDVVITTGAIPPTALIHLGMVSLSPMQIALDGFGMPGCSAYGSTDVLALSVFPGTSQTWTALTIPTAPLLAGVGFTVQAAILGTTQNPAFGLGMQTSNALDYTIGAPSPLAVTYATPLVGAPNSLVTIAGSGFVESWNHEVLLARGQADVISATSTSLVANFLGAPDANPGPIQVSRGVDTLQPNGTVTLAGMITETTVARTFEGDPEVSVPAVHFTPTPPSLPDRRSAAGTDTLTLDLGSLNWTANPRFRLTVKVNGKRHRLLANLRVLGSSGTPTTADYLAHLQAHIIRLAQQANINLTVSVAGGALVISVPGATDVRLTVLGS